MLVSRLSAARLCFPQAMLCGGNQGVNSTGEAPPRPRFGFSPLSRCRSGPGPCAHAVTATFQMTGETSEKGRVGKLWPGRSSRVIARSLPYAFASVTRLFSGVTRPTRIG